MSVKAFARRYGVDRYTAYADLIAIGLRVAPGDNRWAVGRLPRRSGRLPSLLISLLISMRVGSGSVTNACSLSAAFAATLATRKARGAHPGAGALERLNQVTVNSP